jgi:hypothetical protein
MFLFLFFFRNWLLDLEFQPGNSEIVSTELVLDISLLWNITNVSFFLFSLGTSSWTWNLA